MPLSGPLPRCSQDAVAGQVISELFTNRKENIPLKFSEDCLYLNIYTPADLRKKSKLPVSGSFQHCGSSGGNDKRVKAAGVGAFSGTPCFPYPPQSLYLSFP